MSERTGRLLDYWLPPEGSGRPLACLATTFTFEPDFFEGECLSRFLGLDSRRGENRELDLAFLIEQEERLAETRVCVVVDRSEVREGRSLRWDVLPAGVPSGVQHAKVAVLVWQRLMRILVTSANLTEVGYRYNVETGLAVDALAGGRLPASLFNALLEAVKGILEKAPGDPERPGPLARALDTVALAGNLMASFSLPASFPPGLKLDVVAGGPDKGVVPRLAGILRGGPPRRAVVMSPFFDTHEEKSLAGIALAGLMAQRGPTTVTFVIPVDSMDQRTVLRAPSCLLRSLSSRMEVAFKPFRQLQADEVRRLHGKALLLENEEWTTALVGSSNFTAAGLALSPFRANLELNLAVTARAESKEAGALRALFSAGDPLDLSTAEWAPEEDAEDKPLSVLPWGFRECLLHPDVPKLELIFGPPDLPSHWAVRDPISGIVLMDHGAWMAAGSPERIDVVVSGDRFPLFLEVTWESKGGQAGAGWAVNVTEPGKLPAPEELRDLPAQALLQALASTRPIHESLARFLVARESGHADHVDEMDPLKRYSGTGRLLARARQVSAALMGLKQRLERPAGSLDALEWRLNGPVGPTAVAESLGRADEPGSFLKGERAFLLGELALTLSRVDWSRTAGVIPIDEVKSRVRETVRALDHMRRDCDAGDERLMAYAAKAFRKAGV